jgi:hypothetical protein
MACGGPGLKRLYRRLRRHVQVHAPALVNLLWVASKGGLACLKKAMRGKRNSCPPLPLFHCVRLAGRSGRPAGWLYGLDFQDDMRRRRAAVRGPVVYEDEERTF